MLIFLVDSLRYKVYSPNEVAKDELSSPKLNPNRPPPPPPRLPYSQPSYAHTVNSKGQSPLSPSLPPYHDCMWGRTVFTWLADDPPQLWRGGDWRTLNCWVSFVIYEEA